MILEYNALNRMKSQEGVEIYKIVDGEETFVAVYDSTLDSSMTEGVIYETAPESGKIWVNSPLVELSQPKTMVAPMSTPSGVVKPSDKANDSSS